MIDRHEAAIVRPANSIADRISRLKSRYQAHIKNKEEMGKELFELKQQCISEQKEWLPILERTGIPERSASRYIKEYCDKLPCESHNGQVADVPQDESQIHAANPTPKPSANGYMSKEERLGIGKPVSYIDTHAVPSRNGHTTLPPIQIMREPGDDTDVIAADKKALREQPKNGRPIFDWKLIEDPYAKLVRSIDVLGHAYGCKESNTLNGIRTKLASAHSVLKEIYQKKGV